MTGLISETSTVFAYGSNMLTARMLARAPAARVGGPAFLERFALRWNKRSKDGSGKCSIEETGRREDSVWGVLYELNPADKKQLDAFEGLGRGYGERSVTVLANGKVVRVHAYYATSVDLNVRPYDWYRELVVAGAREYGLPAEYIQSLEGVLTIKDSDDSRAARERQLLMQCKTKQNSTSGQSQNSAKEFPFPRSPEESRYRLFPAELESDPHVFFHGTAANNLKPILDRGFEHMPTSPSVSFAKNSDLALKYACEKRTVSSPDGCVLAVRYEQLDRLAIDYSTAHDYRCDPQPVVIGYCIVPADYRHI